MGIVDFIFKQSLIITVQHSIPGRVRLVIPLIRKIDEGFSPALDTIEKLLFTIPGVMSIEPNYLSGRVLILYKPEEVDVETIIRCFKVIWRTLVTYRKKFSNIDNFEKVGEQVVDYVISKNINLKKITSEVKIPDEVWI